MQIGSPIIPLQPINDVLTKKHGIQLFVLRTDLNHPTISGNKLFKLKYNLIAAKESNKKTVLTFGGAYSNHIAATAAAGKECGLKTIGIIRGDELKNINPTLQLALQNGMQLHYVSRALFQDKNALNNYMQEQFSLEEIYLIPEGGSNELGVIGCKEITSSISIPYDTVCCACGTGATMAGITLSITEKQKALGFQILKSENYMQQEVEKWQTHFKASPKNWAINEYYHFGGYAKLKPALTRFMEQFEQEHAIPLDFIYTGKMMFGIYDLIKKDYFKKGETVVAIHTGGIQGNVGFNVKS
jgi:1-aminocyclopropane-1-carboxylate deaminase